MMTNPMETIKEACAMLGSSIFVIKKVKNLLDPRTNTDGFIYTDDVKVKGIFEQCKEEHEKITKNIEVIEELLKNTSQNEKLANDVRELKESFNGFYLMICEVEVEQSAVEYIDTADRILRNITNHLEQL